MVSLPEWLRGWTQDPLQATARVVIRLNVSYTDLWELIYMARLPQSAERKALNLVVVGSSPTVGVSYAEGVSRNDFIASLHV